MSLKFIKLSHMIINTAHINKIVLGETKYYISLMNKNSFGMAFMGVGFMESRDEDIIVCSIKHPINYKIVTDWIDKECK